MTTKEIKHKIEENFGAESIIESELNVQQPFLIIHPLFLVDVCYFLKNEEPFYFDYLSALTGVDYGPSENKMAVIYHLYSLSQGHFLVLKCLLTRSKEASRQSQVQPSQQSEECLPEAPSVSEIWLAADWHERETYDLLGIRFVGRENLRRILLPEDWEGFPLRKDYTTQSTYHEIQVDYY